MSSFPPRIQWDERLLNHMLFNYKVRSCPLLKKGICSHGDNCFDSHTEHNRRRPKKVYSNQWNYNTDKCHVGYMAVQNCEYKGRCRNYHTSDELRYHPNEYKTIRCTDPDFVQKGLCSRGPTCWQFHDESDRRDPRHTYTPHSIDDTGLRKNDKPPQQYLDWCTYKASIKPSQSQQPQQPQQPPHSSHSSQSLPHQQSPQRSMRQAPPNSHHNDNNYQFNNNMKPPHSNPPSMNQQNDHYRNHSQQKPAAPPLDDEKKSENRRNLQTQRQHDQWLNDMAKWFLLFKTKPCSKGSACPKGVNCMEYHGPEDQRRYLTKDGAKTYKAAPCPHIFDYWNTKKFYHDKGCPNGDECEYAHNYYELGYHQKTYKTQKCPYLTATEMSDGYKIKECPYNRTEDWFRQYFGHKVSKITGNTVKYKDEGYTMRSCLDYCPFYHGEHDRRYPEDPDISYDKNKKKSQSVLDKPAQMDMNANMPPHVQKRPVYPHEQSQQQQQQRSPPQYEPNPIPPHNMQSSSTTINNNRAKPGMSQIDIDQHKAELEEFANEDGDDW